MSQERKNKIYRAAVPGRVNLIGEWIDFNGGTVLPMALKRSVRLEMRPNNEEKDRVSSAQYEDLAFIDCNAPAQEHWSDYVRGSLQYARARGWIACGMDVTLSSDIPVGAGLSSSAATVVATLRAASQSIPGIDATTIALAAQQVENEFIGVPCGIMDQMAVAISKNGHALALDTRTLSHQLIKVPGDWTFAVIHSGIGRELADGRYRIRREECLRAADRLGVEYLCDGELKTLNTLPYPLAERAHHVISEGKRALMAVDALQSGDRRAFGRLMSESHVSLRKHFDVSVPAIDAIVADAVALGAHGARITGAGFGGCIVCLLDADSDRNWWPALKARHEQIERIA
jgi:galactokinase